MTYLLTIYKGKQLLTIVLISAFILLFFDFIISILYLNALSCAIGGILIIPLSGMIGLKFSKRQIDVILDNQKIEFGDSNTLLNDIQGYYINRESPILTAIEFKDKNNRIFRMQSLRFGKSGKIFESFLADLLKKTQIANKDFKELSYYNFHNKQLKFNNIYFYIAWPIGILLNLFYFYLIVFKNVHFNWRLIFLNILLISTFNFHKKNKELYKK